MRRTTKRVKIAAVLISLAFRPVDSRQYCSRIKHVRCIKNNGNGWGCDKHSENGQCCRGKCVDKECSNWICEDQQVMEPSDIYVEKLVNAFRDFEESLGLGSGNDDAPIIPSFVADMAWASLAKEFRRFILSECGVNEMGPPIVRVFLLAPRRLRVSSAGPPTNLCGLRFVEFTRKSPSLSTVLDSVVDIEIDRDCDILREDTFTFGVYASSTNLNGRNLRPADIPRV